MPLEWADRDVFRGDWSPLSGFRVPTLAFQNEHDPVADHTFTEDALTTHAPEFIELVTTAGDNHGYFEFDIYESRVRDFLQIS